MSFGMFGGEKTKVKLEFDNVMFGVMIDRFGKDITIRPAKKKGWSEINVDVAIIAVIFPELKLMNGICHFFGHTMTTEK